MRPARIFTALGALLTVLCSPPPSAIGAGNPMTLVGTLAPWPAGQYSNVAADATRHVAYLGSYDDQGVAVIDNRDPANPILSDRLSTHITSELLTSDYADLVRVGRYLDVRHQPWLAPNALDRLRVTNFV